MDRRSFLKQAQREGRDVPAALKAMIADVRKRYEG